MLEGDLYKEVLLKRYYYSMTERRKLCSVPHVPRWCGEDIHSCTTNLLLTVKQYKSTLYHFRIALAGKDQIKAFSLSKSDTLVAAYFWWAGVGEGASYRIAFSYACCCGFLVGGNGKEC